MHLVHLKDMVRGCQQHAPSPVCVCRFGQDHGLQDVDGLGYVGHVNPVAVLVENIQVNGGHQRVAERVLLVEKARVRTGFYLIPGTPFVHNQPNFALRVVFVHHRAVAGEQFVHLECIAQHWEPLILAKTGGGQLVLPRAPRV